MAKERKPLDISQSPELLRLAEEVRRSQQPIVLVSDAEELVEVRPVKSKATNSGQRKSRRSKRSTNPNDWLLRLVDMNDQPPLSARRLREEFEKGLAEEVVQRMSK